MVKKNIYVAQFGTDSNINLIPLSAGLLISRLKLEKNLLEKINIEEIKFIKEKPEELLSKLYNVLVMGFSCYVWNLNYSLEIAKRVKEKFPESLIVVGGPSIPFDNSGAKEFFEANPYVDVICKWEGEESFAQLCKAHQKNKSFIEIPNIIYREKEGGNIFFNNFGNVIDLEKMPSPYLDGTFDELYQRYKKNFSGIILEATRGCPYNCSYCEWGSQSSKIREYTMERLKKEVEWVGRNKIDYISMADGNFGICDKDLKFVELLVNSKKNCGHPSYISVSWVKNSSERVLMMSKLMKEHGIGFKITLSLQSLDENVLGAINRININMEHFKKIKSAYQKDNAYSYTELIFSLPKETYDSFILGIEKSLSESIFDQVYIYPFFLLPNTHLSTKENIQKYGIETIKVESGYTKRKEIPIIKEYLDLVVSTKDMPREKWRDAFVISNYTLALHNNRIAFFILEFLRREYQLKITDFITFLEGYSKKNDLEIIKDSFLKLRTHSQAIQKGTVNNLMKPLPSLYGGVPFDPPEAMFLELLEKKDYFYKELLVAIEDYLFLKKINCKKDILEDLFHFQESIMSHPEIDHPRELILKFNWIDYFKYSFQLEKVGLEELNKKYKVKNLKPCFGNREDFLNNHFDVRGVPLFNILFNGDEKEVFPPVKLS